MPNSIGSAQRQSLSSIDLQNHPEPGMSAQRAGSKQAYPLPKEIKHRSGQQLHKSHRAFVGNAKNSNSSSLKQLGVLQQKFAQFSAKMSAARTMGRLVGGMTSASGLAVTAGLAVVAGIATGGIGFIPIAVAAGGALLSVALGFGVSTKITSSDTKNLEHPLHDFGSDATQVPQSDATKSDKMIAEEIQRNQIDIYRSTKGGPPLGTPGNHVNEQVRRAEPGQVNSEQRVQIENDHPIARAWQEALNDQHDLTNGRLNLDQLTPGQKKDPPVQAEDNFEGDQVTMEGNEVPLPQKYETAGQGEEKAPQPKQADVQKTMNQEGES